MLTTPKKTLDVSVTVKYHTPKFRLKNSRPCFLILFTKLPKRFPMGLTIKDRTSP